MVSVKILVVDDDPAIRNLISRYLSQQDYQVEMAGDGHSALERFEQFQSRLGGIGSKFAGYNRFSIV